VSAFDAAWLRLREPLDAASRAHRLAGTLRRVLPERPLAVTDLATGTGSNLRYLCARLAGSQSWTLIDRERALLDALPAQLDAWAHACGARLTRDGDTLLVGLPGLDCRARTLCRDLADLDALELPAGSLVTASALLDLVSAGWLEALAERCLAARAAALFALTYDGRIGFEPREPDDATVTALVNRHQLGDKGFGPALGPAAGEHAREAFARRGFHVATARSDWHIRPDARALQDALLDGWLAAASEIEPDRAAALERWAAARRAHVAAGRSALTVGHVDVLAWLAPARSEDADQLG
jgi:hypothetical protein